MIWVSLWVTWWTVFNLEIYEGGVWRLNYTVKCILWAVADPGVYFGGAIHDERGSASL